MVERQGVNFGARKRVILGGNMLLSKRRRCLPDQWPAYFYGKRLRVWDLKAVSLLIWASWESAPTCSAGHPGLSEAAASTVSAGKGHSHCPRKWLAERLVGYPPGRDGSICSPEVGELPRYALHAQSREIPSPSVAIQWHDGIWPRIFRMILIGGAPIARLAPNGVRATAEPCSRSALIAWSARASSSHELAAAWRWWQPSWSSFLEGGVRDLCSVAACFDLWWYPSRETLYGLHLKYGSNQTLRSLVRLGNGYAITAHRTSLRDAGGPEHFHHSTFWLNHWALGRL